MRTPRLSLPHVSQHVVLRGNNGENLFRTSHDCATYLNYLKTTLDKHSARVHAYVLMPNHVHLLMSSVSGCGVSKTLQALARHYVPYFNHRYARSGALFTPRYRSALVEQGQAELRVSRYIERNPIRSRICKSSSDYPWSSFRANALGYEDELVTESESYRAIAEGDKERCSVYRQMLEYEGSVKELQEIRRETNRSRVIGSESFLRRVENHFGISLRSNPRGGDRRSDQYRASRIKLAKCG